MSPDPAFLTFFDTAFRRRVETAEIPGLPNASWDRKAAWLLWLAERDERPAPLSEVAPDKSDEGSVFD